jgi:hypothetical protein
MALPKNHDVNADPSRLRSAERGASMVEMAMVLPLFLILVFGIIEFSYALAQHNEIRHVIRAAARVASVDAAAAPGAMICTGFDLIPSSDVTYEITGVSPATGGPGGIAEVIATAPYRTLTGFFDTMFAGTTIDSRHNFYVEQQTIDAGPSWPTGGTVICP